MRRSSIAIRLVAAAVLWIVGALMIGGWVLSGLFRGYVERSFDARFEALLGTLIAGADVDEEGRLVLTRGLGAPQFDTPYSGWYWQFANEKGPLFRSRSLWDEVLAHEPLGTGQIQRSYVAGPRNQVLRMLARRVTLPGSTDFFHVAVAADTAETAAEILTFDQTLLWSLTALGLGLIVAIVVQVRYGLRPMRRLRAELASIRSGRSDHLSGDFPVEVRPLVDDLNALLEHNAALVERARTHVGNLAHALKTPLSVLAGEVSRDGAASREVMLQEVAKIRHHVEHHLARARTAASGRALGVRTTVLPVVEAIKRTLERIHPGRPVTIRVNSAEAAVFRGQREDLEEVVGNLVENACKWARSQVRVGIDKIADRIVLTVDDDGPGLEPERRTAVLERGMRLDETAPGSGLGLAIVRDIVAAYGGKFHLDDSPMGGLRATVALPAADAGA